MIATTEVRHADAPGQFLFVCEHASNAFPEEFGGLGLDEAARQAHVAWDPGALGLARGLSDVLGSPLVAATASRLVYDCNRPPDAPGAMCERSEAFDIPGNLGLDAAARIERTEAVYLPFQAALTRQLARMLARGRRPVLVTIHSFTPLWFGTPRTVELGIIHDTDASFALALADAARDLPLRTALNQPYSAADGVAHTLKLHATPHGLPHAMLEIRNDLIADAAAQAAMAAQLAPVLERARAALPVKGRAA
ncbi:N-formylglutamate amidohydrolase [Paracoccus sp. S-4012]|uniref:N-formylglutamate amidohydrolase n=1 Tax=Paracoccus sp. S-4012 TaxID=2665648 RepID=UPI0012B09B18|nr:N-formylglutamate amidohydrolase [Paracoccus sp. S-4012]MRX49955.1 N-formylglutamate amidohydrolase [Paracoccus sp. S-4012]